MKKKKEQPKSKIKVYQPHDKFIHCILKNAEDMENLIFSLLPPSITSFIEKGSFQYVDEKYLSSKLSANASDFLVSAKFKGKDIFFLVLFEHKSTIEHDTIFQVLYYMLSTWYEKKFQKQNDNAYPVIFPIVFYHGEPQWTPSLQLKNYFRKEDVFLFEKYIPQFEYYLHNVTEKDFHKLSKYKDLQTMAKTLYYNQRKLLCLHFEEIVSIYKKGTEKDIQKCVSLLVYTYSTNEDPEGFYLQKTQEILGNEKVNIMTLIAEQFREEGRNEFKELLLQEVKKREKILKKMQEEQRKREEMENLMKEAILRQLKLKFPHRFEEFNILLQNAKSIHIFMDIQNKIFSQENEQDIYQTIIHFLDQKNQYI